MVHRLHELFARVSCCILFYLLLINVLAVLPQVRDEEAGEGETQSHVLPPERVILLPKSNHSRDHPLVLQPSSEVRRGASNLDNNHSGDCL
jgi:hypothetical protein